MNLDYLGKLQLAGRNCNYGDEIAIRGMKLGLFGSIGIRWINWD